jgi:hypothetical protein
MAEPMPPSCRRVGRAVVSPAAAAAAALVLSVAVAWGAGGAGCAGFESWDGFSEATPARVEAGSSGGPDDASTGDADTTPRKIVPGQANSTSFDGPTVDQVKVTLNQPLVQGDLLVVAIGWYDDSVKVTSVTDSLGNSFRPASDPVIISGNKPAVQVIYFASGVTGGASDNVTVAFDDRADSPDVRVAEYSGFSPTKSDGVTSQTGTSADPSTGQLTTQFAPELLVAAGLTYDTEYTDAGPDFSVRVISKSGNILEDRIVDHPDTYSAHAVMESSEWLMQLVAFH